MRKIRQLCAAAFLVVVLTTAAFAGDIQLPSVTSPPPDQQQPSATGDIQNPSASVAGQMDIPFVSDPVAQAALAMTLNALSVF